MRYIANLDGIAAELKSERDRLVHAIEALAGPVLPTTTPPRRAGRAKTKIFRRMSAAARKRIQIAMKKRWADRESGG